MGSCHHPFDSRCGEVFRRISQKKAQKKDSLCLASTGSRPAKAHSNQQAFWSHLTFRSGGFCLAGVPGGGRDGAGRRRCGVHRRVRQDATGGSRGNPRGDGAADHLHRQGGHHHGAQLAHGRDGRRQPAVGPLRRHEDGGGEHRPADHHPVSFRPHLHRQGTHPTHTHVPSIFPLLCRRTLARRALSRRRRLRHRVCSLPRLLYYTHRIVCTRHPHRTSATGRRT